MRFGIFNNFGALNSAPVFQAFQQGLDNLGLPWSPHDTSADIAVIWSVVWAGRMKSNQDIWNQFRDSQRPVIVLEVGALHRGHTWKMAVNGTGLQAFWGAGLDIRRVERLGITLKPWRTTGEHIVVAAQREDSEQWRGMPPMKEWLSRTVDTLRLHTDREIRVRTHPRQRIEIPQGCRLDLPEKLADTYDDFDFARSLEGAWAVVNWNSGMACQAVMQGVPCFVGPSNLAAPVANLDWSHIERPELPDRSRWLIDLAHTEWTVPEIASGMPMQRLLPGL